MRGFEGGEKEDTEIGSVWMSFLSRRRHGCDAG